jgi:15-cis-phytoene synthase
MKQLFDQVSQECSRITTKTYSTSFSLGILFLSKRFRNPIYAIYGFVRLADEIVDSFHDFDKAQLLSDLKVETYQAIEQKISLNPILNAFQETVHRYNIDHKLIEAFLKSMEMDLKKSQYKAQEYNEYIFGSAEAVGLMCLFVFTEGDLAQYTELKPFAQKLGSAFQKVNFLRDVKADNLQLGRTYFPNVDLTNFSEHDKALIEIDIENDFKDALHGIKQRKGVYLAYYYYLNLFRKIKQTTPQRIMEERIRIPNHQKYYLLLKSEVKLQLNML